MGICLSESGMGPAHSAVVQKSSARSYSAFLHQDFALHFLPWSPEEVGMSGPSRPRGFVSVSQIRLWHKSPWDGSALGRGVPHQPARLSSQILGQTKTWGDRSRFLLFKQQPHVEIPPMKSRRCFSRQRDKNPF